MKLTSRLLQCLVLFLYAEVAFADNPTVSAYRVDYIEETVLLKNDTALVVVNLDLEWPKRLCGSKVPVLQSYLCNEMFGIKVSTLDEGKKQFFEQIGRALETMPDDSTLKKCYLYIKLKELAWEPNNWISFRLVIVGRDATMPQNKLFKSLLFTYDLVGDKVLTTNDLIKSRFRIQGYNNDQLLDVFDYYYPAIDQMADGDRLPDQTCLLTSDLGVAFNLVGTDTGDGMEHLLVAPKKVVINMLSSYAKKMMEMPARDRWMEIKKKKDMVFKVDDDAMEDDMAFPMPDTMPQFRGGDQQFAQFLSKEVKYPTYESLLHLEGKSLVSFIVEKTGKVHSPSIVIPSSPGFDREAVRAVLAMPEWIPATRDGVPVDMRMTIPVKFQLKQE